MKTRKRKPLTHEAREYIVRYNREHYKRFSIRLRRDSENDVIEWLENMENINGYLKKLVRADMNRGK